MKRSLAFALGLQISLVGTFALAQDANIVGDLGQAPVAENQTPAQPDAKANGPHHGPRHELTAQEKCDFQLREIAHHLRGVDAMVSRDGSITINSDREKGKMAKSDNALIGASKIEIYGKQGTSSVDGLSCAFDKTKKVGDGAAKLISLFQNETEEFHQLMTEHRPEQKDAGRPDRRHGDPAEKFANHVVEACAQVYPEVEALRAKLAPATQPTAPTTASSATTPSGGATIVN